MRTNWHLLLLCTLALATLPAPVQGLTPVITDLPTRALGNPILNRHGESVAASDLYIVVGEPENDDGVGIGAAHVYDAVTGAWKRRLVPSDGTAGDGFGFSVAVCGSRALVASTGVMKAYVFDLKTGKELHRLTPSAATGGYGYRVAYNGSIAAIGAWLDDTEGNNAGAVFYYDLEGAPVAVTEDLILTAGGDAAADDRFGCSVSLTDGLLAIGALRSNGANTDSGAVFLHDARTGALMHKFIAADGQTGDEFGLSVALDGNLLLVGAQSAAGSLPDTGACYLFNTRSLTLLNRFHAADGTGNSRFGSSVALRHGLALVGAWLEDEPGVSNAGAAYLCDPRSSGPGVKTSNDLALYLRQENDSYLLLMREGQPRQDLDGAAVGTIQRVVASPFGRYVVLASVTGAAATNQAIFTGDYTAGNATTLRSLRQPAMKLRKGALLQAVGGSATPIRSLSIFPTLDKSGSPGRGVPNSVAFSGHVMTVQFDNQAVELMAGDP